MIVITPTIVVIVTVVVLALRMKSTLGKYSETERSILPKGLPPNVGQATMLISYNTSDTKALPRLPPRPPIVSTKIVPVDSMAEIAPFHERTFATSNFKRFYANAQAPAFQHYLLGAVNNMLKMYANRINPTLNPSERETSVNEYMTKLQEDVFTLFYNSIIFRILINYNCNLIIHSGVVT